MKHVNTKYAPVIGSFLPYNSDSGANAEGPEANPHIYKVNLNNTTIFPTPNSILTGSTAAEYTELPHDATRVSKPRAKAYQRISTMFS